MQYITLFEYEQCNVYLKDVLLLSNSCIEKAWNSSDRRDYTTQLHLLHYLYNVKHLAYWVKELLKTYVYRHGLCRSMQRILHRSSIKAETDLTANGNVDDFVKSFAK